jgi:endonuclease/exonuclease/phosphatase family metal-dependent hydrolase
VALVVRTWNLFHGNAVPPGRHAFLERMVRLVAAGADLVCLQEVPVWALGRLAGWSGMTAVGKVAAPPRLGPLPSTAAIGRRLTAVHPGALRSAFAGQANAILVAPRLRVLDSESLVLNPLRFRRAQAAALGLDLVLRLAWAKERRVCQALRLALPDGGGTAWVSNLHATSLHADERIADAELRRAAAWTDGLGASGEPRLFCGDLNLPPERSPALRELRGYSEPLPGRIDQVLVRGLPAAAPEVWPDERRRVDGRLLSDHAPVEVAVG